MSQFKYTLPSGSKFLVEAPVNTTQSEADFIFYNQVAAGALVEFEVGQSVSEVTTAVTKFELSRLDRGTAGLDDVVILAIVNGLPAVADIPSLINVPLTNPITQASIAEINSTGFTAPAIGSLTSNQTLALMAQVASTVGQSATAITNETGVGSYGLDCQRLEMAGYVKPGTWQQFIQTGRSTLIGVLNAPGIWTGLGGINTVAEFLNSSEAQNTAQATLMVNGYASLQAAGVITTPAAQSVSAVVGQVFTGTDPLLTSATTTLTNSVNGQVAQLVTNASQRGTQLTAQWASGLPGLTGLTSNLISIKGLSSSLASLPASVRLGSLTSGITPNLAGVKTAMDNLAKGAEFAARASSTLTGGLDKLSNLNVSSLTANLPSASALAGQLQGRALAAAGQLQGQITGQAQALIGQAQGQAQALIGQAQAQANALLAQAQGQFNLLRAQGDKLVAAVQQAPGFANTVDRASIDVATTKIFGSAKIPTPNFGPIVAESKSLLAAADISKAQGILKNLQGQGTALLNQAQGQATALVGQARTVATTIV
jgi:cell division septum initiation protein DivIVA